MRQITKIKMDELGWVLLNHDLVIKTNNVGLFSFKMDRIRELVEKHISKCDTDGNNNGKKDPNCDDNNNNCSMPNLNIVKAEGLFQVKYITTIERIQKHSFAPTLTSCFICRRNFIDEKAYSEHFDTLPGPEFRVNIDSEDGTLKTGQKFDLSSNYNAVNPVTLFTLRNLHSIPLRVTNVYLYNDYRHLIPINKTIWPVTINSGDSFSFSIMTDLFNKIDHNYSIFIQFNRVLDYVEQFHFVVTQLPKKVEIVNESIFMKRMPEYRAPNEIMKIFDMETFEKGKDFNLRELEMFHFIR